MYENHFGFSEKPFELTPDPSFLYVSHEIREIIATLKYCIMERRGFALLVGEPGTGKTTLINTLMDLPDDHVNFAYVFNPAFDFKDLLQTVLVEFGLVSEDEVISKRNAIRKLNDYAIERYQESKRTVIVVDEAQYLDIGTLENLRLLSNLETRKHKLFQLIIAGQPELEQSLNHPKLIQLTQRIGLRRRTTPFNQKEASEYIRHRLKIAGYEGPQLFGNLAKQMVWQFSGGNARKINLICDSALLIGYASGKKRIDSAIVNEAIADINTIAFDNKPYSETKPAETGYPPIEANSGDRPDLSAGTSMTPESESGNSTEGTAEEPHKEARPPSAMETKVQKSHWQKAVSMPVIVGVMIVLFSTTLGISLFLLSNQRELKREFFDKFKNISVIASGGTHSSDADGQNKKGLPGKISATIKSSIDQPAMEKSKVATENKIDISVSGDANPIGASIVKGSSQTEKDHATHHIVVKKGESLNEILIREYGGLNDDLLKLVLRKNPEIENPNHIMENQVIVLPKTGQEPTKED